MRVLAREYDAYPSTVSRGVGCVEDEREEPQKDRWISQVCYMVKLGIQRDRIEEYIERHLQHLKPKRKRQMAGHRYNSDRPIITVEKGLRTMRGWLPEKNANLWLEMVNDADLYAMGLDPRVEIESQGRHEARLKHFGPTVIEMVRMAGYGVERAEKHFNLPARSMKAVIFSVTTTILETKLCT